MIDSVSSGNLQAIQTQAISGADRAAKAYGAQAEKISRGEVDVPSIVDSNQQSSLYTANLQVISTADEMVGQVLNLRA
jgi:flagellar hook protein FlgE